MGIFDFLKGKSKTEEETVAVKPASTSSNPKTEEAVIEVKGLPVKSKAAEGQTITDIDGNVYTTVKIGKQVWTVENLKTTKFNDGEEIPIWSSYANDNKLPAYCWYGNNMSNKEKYGALYNWYAVNTGKLSPKGWHVPTDAEWTELEKYLIANGYNWDGSKEGNKIAKALAAKTNWNSHNDLGTIGNGLSKNNDSGFSAIPGGYLNIDGSFDNQNEWGRFWSATNDGAMNACQCDLNYFSEHMYKGSADAQLGFSVRLLRD